MQKLNAERARLEQDRLKQKNWRSWGPYVSERSWGTVREDYSHNGEAWDFLTHDHARSKAYRWGEDGLAGFCDRYQLLVFSIALWNGRDSMLKERLFGVVPDQSNHGEDVKEYYYYLDATPTHSYLKYLYKYPQSRFPYEQLVRECKGRDRTQPEFELLDTGIFDSDHYFDVFVEYAKVDTEDICIRIEAFNRGPEAAVLHLLPQMWFRNRWGWSGQATPEPRIGIAKSTRANLCLIADDSSIGPLTNLLEPYQLGRRFLYASADGRPLFTNNESNCERLYGPRVRSRSPFVKDAFHRHVIYGEPACNPEAFGTKACIHFERRIESGESTQIYLRMSDQPVKNPLKDAKRIIELRRQEADDFYEQIHPPQATSDERMVQRQALAGMIWTKQIYLFDVRQWLEGDNPEAPPPSKRRFIRNQHWKHLNSMRIFSMPDKWEYPWFAAWDLAFQCIPLALVDPEFAKEQLWLLLFEQFQHPNGQIPAYEWEFSDLNPPVHAWAVWRVYNMDRIQSGRADLGFLEKCFHKLLINFAWWVNKVDGEGHNVFEGGFLGLDNITTFDRSQSFSDGSSLKQADATGWMGMFCLNLMRIALELAKESQAYVGLATKFFEHYVYIGAAMKNMGGRNYQLWSEQDGLFYDVLEFPDGSFHRFRLRSLVSLIPLFATERLEENWIVAFPEFRANLNWFLRNRSELSRTCVSTHENESGQVHLLSLVSKEQLCRILQTMWDRSEFRSPYGLRSLSKYHEHHPYRFAGQEVRYEPGETSMWLKGGNSNWRGPLWFPTTFLMIESLRKLAKVYGDSLYPETSNAKQNGETCRSNVSDLAASNECFDNSETDQLITEELGANLLDMARGYADGMISLFTRNEAGQRPIFGQREKMQQDPYWRDHLLFHEYFNADTGEGLGACHQTGWTGLVASLIDEWRR